MNDQTKAAMQMALEALEDINQMQDYYGNGFDLGEEINALREALAQTPKVNEFEFELCEDEGCPQHGTVHYCRSTKQPGYEPVGFVRIDRNGDCELHGHTLWQLGSGDYNIYIAPQSVEAERERIWGEANRRANLSWGLMCEKLVAAEREKAAKVCVDMYLLAQESGDDEETCGRMTALAFAEQAIRGMK